MMPAPDGQDKGPSRLALPQSSSYKYQGDVERPWGIQMRERKSFAATVLCIAVAFVVATPFQAQDPEHSVARIWDETLLDAIRLDLPKPPVHARNLFHLSVAMWDAWAAYDDRAIGYVSTGKKG